MAAPINLLNTTFFQYCYIIADGQLFVTTSRGALLEITNDNPVPCYDFPATRLTRYKKDNSGFRFQAVRFYTDVFPAECSCFTHPDPCVGKYQCIVPQQGSIKYNRPNQAVGQAALIGVVVALDCDAPQQAALVGREVGAPVHRAPVVPHHQVALAPDVLVDEIRLLRMVVQPRQ